MIELSKNRKRKKYAGIVIPFVFFLLLSTGHFSADASDYSIDWYSIDSGGAMNSSGEIYKLSGTVGQPDAHIVKQDVYKITGAFWSIGSGSEVVPTTDKLVDYILGKAGGESFDGNNDGLVDIADVIWIIKNR
jgi:hypothetical protein